MAYNQQDPPNWHQLSSYQTSGGGGGGGGDSGGSGGGGINQNSLNNLLQPPIVSNIGGSILRPPAGLTSDHRARVTKLLVPQQGDQQLLALNCPRCDSTNTKFCYFNNYSLTQPRHFCKTCRRYWTRGGALRNVPVGGGCRRNKRSKGSTSNTTTTTSSRSKSPVSNAVGSASNTSTTSISTSNMLGHFVHPPSHQVQSPFYPSLRNLSSFGTTSSRDNIRLNFSGGGGGGDAIGDPIFPIGLGHEMQQFQFPSPQMQQFNFASGGLDHHQQQQQQQQYGLYQQYDQIIQGGGVDQLSGFIEGTSHMIRSNNSKQPLLDFGVASSSTHLNSLKSEENQEQLNSSRNFMGAQGNNEQYWGNVGGNNNANAINNSTNAWSDLSSFTSAFSKP